MNEPDHQGMDRAAKELQATIQVHWKFLLIQGVFMIALGALAVSLPHIATIAFEISVGWLFLLVGGVKTFAALKSRYAPGYWWSMATTLLAIVFGLVLIAQPVEGIVTLTIAVIIIFIVEGVAAILIALEYRRHVGNWGWHIFSGVVNLALAYFLWKGLPATADWAIGVLIGINLITTGFSLTMLSLAARKSGKDS